MATDRQLAYIDSLLTTRDVPPADADMITASDLSIEPTWVVSRLIDRLLSYPTRPVVAAAIEQVHRIDMAQHGRPTSQGTTAGNRVIFADVPEGRYAIDVDGEVMFYRVDRPIEGRWAGYTFLAVQASDDFHSVRNPETKAQILAAIAVDPHAAQIRYGHLLGVCGVCGRTLTDAASRAAGIGPVCAARGQ